jgi:hypothetical protein
MRSLARARTRAMPTPRAVPRVWGYLTLMWLLGAAVLAPGAQAATLTVGPGRQFASIAAAVSAARDGDVVEVAAGTYTNDVATITRRISIVGVGGMAVLKATANISNGKGLLVTRADTTLRRLRFEGARVADGNGAGIRYESGVLNVDQCHFTNNENGILANPNSTGKIAILRSEFSANGRGDGYTHGIYVNKIAELRVVTSYFHDTKVGHHIKSRASRTIVDNNRIVDGANGTASYNVDVPNGGVVEITNNQIVQGADSQNSAILHFGGEGSPYAGSSMLVTGNTMQNYRSSAIGVVNATGVAVIVRNNRLYQLPRILSGAGTTSANFVLSQPAPVATTPPWQ